MDDLWAEGGIAYIRGSIIGIVPSSPKRSHSSVTVLASRQKRWDHDSLVYKTSVFIGQLYRLFVVHFRVIAVAKVADTERSRYSFGDL